uniref:RING-type E3 ubiquitin transferase n=1 Tax=Lotus japonicus TaxID=34305 RepID=I3SH05_LOTJA|nr:unknown [Lotus japonicus]
MGKKQHSKDRMFITKTEWATEWGGFKSKDNRTVFKRLPFYCCALTFTPFEYPVCTPDGSVFDVMNITPYVIKYGKHPVTGTPLKQQDLIPLNFHKNSEGGFQCPVLNKVFTEFTHIVAVKTTGNVFCYEAVKELNIKTKNWKELLTDEPFTRDDLITIQNPNALDSKFFWILIMLNTI